MQQYKNKLFFTVEIENAQSKVKLQIVADLGPMTFNVSSLKTNNKQPKELN